MIKYHYSSMDTEELERLRVENKVLKGVVAGLVKSLNECQEALYILAEGKK